MSLIKQRGAFPIMNTLLEDFWNSDGFLENRLFGTRITAPAVNIQDREHSFIVEMAAPGLRKDDFSVDLQNGVLRIEAETKQEDEEKTDSYTRREFAYNGFSRSFSLPEYVKQDDINATYENGILRLVLKKEPQAISKRKQIEIR
jgi:HSP20 family protein